jgi:hypothetical protein
MPRSRADERLLKKLHEEAPDTLDAKVDVDRFVGRLLKTPPESRQARMKKAAKTKR